MSEIDAHALNKRLAEIVGKTIQWRWQVTIIGEPDRKGWVYLAQRIPFERWDWWDPCHDPLQMEEVKTWLRKKGFGYYIHYDLYFKQHLVKLWLEDRQWDTQEYESELIAFGQAVVATMEEG